MRRRSLLVARARARLALLVPIAAVVAASVAVPLLATTLGDAGAQSGAAAVITARPARDAAAVVTEPLDDRPAEQRRRVGAAIADRLPARSATVTWSASATAAVDAGRDGQEARLTAVPDLPSVANVVTGAWPSETSDTADAGPVPVAVQADAAARLDLRVGDVVAVGPAGGVPLRVAATWRADDPLAAEWAGASDAGSGTDAGVVGPLVVPVRTVAAVSDSTVASWMVTPVTARGQLVSTDGLRGGLRSVQTATGADDGPLAGADLGGSLGATLARIDLGIETARALVRIAVVVAAVLALVALGVLAAVLRDTRTSEDALFTARGATRAQLVRWTGLESLAVAAVGAVVGVVVAVVLAPVLGHGAVLSPVAGVVTAATAVLVAALVGAVVGGRRRVAAHRTGRWPAAVLAAVAVGAAAFATWRLFTVGVPVRASGSAVVTDPVAALAPVTSVLATALVTVVLVGVVAGVVARGTARTRRFLPSLVARRLSRDRASSAPVVVLVAMSVAVGGLAAGLSATDASVDRSTARILVGAAVRVTADGDDAVGAGTTLSVPDSGRVAGSAAATPVLTDRVTVGGRTVPLVAMPAGRAGRVTGNAGAQAFAGTATSHRAGSVVPAGTRRIAVDVRVGAPTLDGASRPDASGSVQSSLWAVDDEGVAVALPLDAADDLDTGSGPGAGVGSGAGVGTAVDLGGSARLTADLPSDRTGMDRRWRVLAIESTVSFSTRPPETDTGIDGAGLRVRVDAAMAGAVRGSGHTVLRDLSGPSRITLGATALAGRLPVVVTDALADELGLHDGSQLDLDAASTARTLHTRVVGTVPVVPGSGATTAVAADLPTLVDAAVDGGRSVSGSGGSVPRVDEAWFAGADPEAVAAEVARVRTVSGSVTTAASVSSSPVLAPAVGVLAAVAGFGALLALLAVVGSVVTSAEHGRSRTFRALGVEPRAAARARLTEIGAPVAAAVVAGIVGGGLTVATVVAPFAIATVPGAAGLVTATPDVRSPWSLVVPAVVLVGTGVAALVAARRTRTAVATAGPR